MDIHANYRGNTLETQKGVSFHSMLFNTFDQPNDCLTPLKPKMHPQNAYEDTDGIIMAL